MDACRVRVQEGVWFYDRDSGHNVVFAVHRLISGALEFLKEYSRKFSWTHDLHTQFLDHNHLVLPLAAGSRSIFDKRS